MSRKKGHVTLIGSRVRRTHRRHITSGKPVEELQVEDNIYLATFYRAGFPDSSAKGRMRINQRLTDE
jgi:hypothetical protein